MPEYRRYLIPGETYFFAIVTDGRAPILCTDSARAFLRESILECQRERPFEMPAVVLLPDHLHAIWTLPTEDCDYSTRWALIKKGFTERYLAAGGPERSVSTGRRNQRRRGVWQPRFWEHMIRDETDFERHFDYIHYNPVKHGYVSRPRDWPWSSFHRWVRAGVHPVDWGCSPDAGFDFTEIAAWVGVLGTLRVLPPARRCGPHRRAVPTARGACPTTTRTGDRHAPVVRGTTCETTDAARPSSRSGTG
jgi:putative transposase